MHDGQVPTSKIIKTVGWGLVAAMIVLTWALGVLAWALDAKGLWHLAMLCGFTGCATSAGAATAHVRCFHLRLAAMLRAVPCLTGDEGERGGGGWQLHSIGERPLERR